MVRVLSWNDLSLGGFDRFFNGKKKWDFSGGTADRSSKAWTAGYLAVTGSLPLTYNGVVVCSACGLKCNTCVYLGNLILIVYAAEMLACSSSWL